MSKENVIRRLSIYVNGTEVENSLKAVDGAIQHVKNSLRKLVEGTEDYDKKKAELTENLTKLTERQKEYRDELGLTTKAQKESSIGLSEFKENLSKIFVGLSSGDLATAKEGLDGIKGSIGGMVKSAMAFIATPLGAAIAVISGIAIGTKAIFDFNVEAEKSAVLIENLSGKTGKAVEDIRVLIQSMTDTFGLSFEQLAGAVDNLVDTGVAKDELEALDKIKNGLLTAPDKNEFITGLENTAVISKQIGMDLEDVIALKKQIETTGVNPEATFGSLEKATQRLSLGADGLRKKMSEALGAGFTDDVLAKVTTGQISITKALDLINTKSKELGLNQTQQAELGKELFGKGAIAAGGYAVVLDTVAESIRKQKEPLNENQKALAELEAANTKLGKAQSELFRVENFGSIWTNIKAKAIDTLGSILDWISDVKNEIQPLISLVKHVFVGAWDILKVTVQTTFDFIGGVFKVFSLGLETLVSFFSKIIQGDFSGAINVLKNSFLKLGSIVGDTFGKIKNHVIDSLKSIVDNVAPFLDAIGMDVDKIQKKLDSFKSKEVVLKTSSENGKTNENQEVKNTKATEEELAKQKALRDAARQKEIEAHKKALAQKKAEEEKVEKELWEKYLALAKAKADLSKAELNYFIETNKSKIDSETKLTDEIVAEETRRILSIYNKKQAEINNEKKNKIAHLDLEKKTAEEKAILIETIELEYQTKSLILYEEFNKSKNDLDKKYLLEEKQKLLDEEATLDKLAIAMAGNKRDEELAKLKQSWHQEKNEYQALYDSKKITKENFDIFIAASNKKYNDAEKAIKTQQVKWTELTENQKLDAIKGALNGASDALNKGSGAWKAVKIAETSIATYQSAVNSYNSLSGIPYVGPVLGGIAAAAAVASGIAQVKAITRTKLETAPKFFYGGSTGTAPNMGTDEYGAVTGVVHANEWVAPAVMTQSPKYAATFSWLENERKAIVGKKFATGGETTTGAVAPYTGENSNNTTEIVIAINKLNQILEKGIDATAVIGYREAKEIQKLNTERELSNQYGTVSK